MIARNVVKALGGRWHGSYGMALCPTHNDGKTPALKVSDAHDGGVIVHCFAGCDWRDVKAELRHCGLLPGDDHRDRRETRQPRRHHPPPSQLESEDTEKRIKAALAIWRVSQPAPGTPVEAYLRHRGITVLVPQSIRYNTATRYTPSALFLPAMIAAVQAPGHRGAPDLHPQRR